jgi:hypothetical protein
MYTFRKFILSKGVNTCNVIYWGNFKYFKEYVAKKNLQKFTSMKKSKCSKKAHLWLSLLLQLAHLIMITFLHFASYNMGKK